MIYSYFLKFFPAILHEMPHSKVPFVVSWIMTKQMWFYTVDLPKIRVTVLYFIINATVRFIKWFVGENFVVVGMATIAIAIANIMDNFVVPVGDLWK